MDKESHFIEINNSKKIWAIGSIHSRLNAFNSIKEHLLQKFEEGDYYINEMGYRVFTSQYLLKRGYCCKNGCKRRSRGG